MNAVAWCSEGHGIESLSTFLICGAHLHRDASGALTAVDQLDPQSLTPLSAVGCGRLHVGAAHWATSVALLKVVNN